MQVDAPYLMFLGDVPDQLAAKTAQGIVDWRPEWCLGQLKLPGCKADLGIADMTIEQAKARGVRTLIVGVANAGGFLPDHWSAAIVEAIEAGMDVASGLHARLASKPAIREAAEKHGRRLTDVRHSEQTFATGKGTKRPGRMGNEKVSQSGLRIVQVDLERNLLLVKGAVPGANGGLVTIQKAQH